MCAWCGVCWFVWFCIVIFGEADMALSVWKWQQKKIPQEHKKLCLGTLELVFFPPFFFFF
eukprot:m.11247 g.11247  ORF g.11247 m.11247 type:complete len:60 (+) comp6344_c0_seq1:56-235(+)